MDINLRLIVVILRFHKRGILADQLVDEIRQDVNSIFVLRFLLVDLVEQLLVLRFDLFQLILSLLLFHLVVHNPFLQELG